MCRNLYFGTCGLLMGVSCCKDFSGGSDGKESACNVGDLGSIPGLERSPGGGHGNPLQYSCLENPKEVDHRGSVYRGHFLPIYITSIQFSSVTQSCPALCYSMDCSSRGSSVHGIFQARILDWVAMIFSRGSSQPRNQTQISCIAGRFFTAEPPGKPQ